MPPILNWEALSTLWRDEKAVQRDLDRSEHWVIVNGMKINESKCQILCLGRSKDRQRYR